MRHAVTEFVSECDLMSEESVDEFELSTVWMELTDDDCSLMMAAVGIARDVSKFLMFACGEVAMEPDWSDRDMVNAFVEKLKASQLKASGIIAKLDALDDALRFQRLQVIGNEDSLAYVKSMRMMETLIS